MNQITKGEQTRAKILQTALHRAATRGLSALSIGDLADRTAMSKSGLFRHFGSKESLQMAVLETLVADFRSAVVHPALHTAGGLSRIDTLFDRYMIWTANDKRRGGCPFIALSLELDGQPGAHRDYLFDQQRLWIDLVTRVTAKCVAEGSFRSDLDVQGFAFEFQSIAIGFNHRAHIVEDRNAENLARNAFHRLLRDARSSRVGITP